MGCTIDTFLWPINPIAWCVSCMVKAWGIFQQLTHSSNHLIRMSLWKAENEAGAPRRFSRPLTPPVSHFTPQHSSVCNSDCYKPVYFHLLHVPFSSSHPKSSFHLKWIFSTSQIPVFPNSSISVQRYFPPTKLSLNNDILRVSLLILTLGTLNYSTFCVVYFETIPQMFYIFVTFWIKFSSYKTMAMYLPFTTATFNYSNYQIVLKAYTFRIFFSSSHKPLTWYRYSNFSASSSPLNCYLHQKGA